MTREPDQQANIERELLHIAKKWDAKEGPVSLGWGVAFVLFLFGLQSLKYVLPWIGQQWQAFISVFGL